MIEVKASIKNGERLKSYNAWNKEMPVAVKGVGPERDAFQLPPQVRVMIPTDTVLETAARIYMNPRVSLVKALVLVSGVQLNEAGKLELYVQNMSESLVTISNGEMLAYAVTS